MSDSLKLALHGGAPVAPARIPAAAVKLGEREIEAAVQVLRSGMLVQGRVTAEFERRFAALTGARHAVATSNGTTALQLVYHALLAPGASAVTPAWTFMATASMVRARPGIPIFADADPALFNLTPSAAAAGIREDTHAIVPVHLYGNPVDIAGFEALRRERGLSVVYDAAQAHMAQYDGRGLGAYGTAVTYSFYPTKNMTTGEGGMITTNDETLADRLRILRNHGMRERYLHQEIGFNYRMTDIAAAIGLAQLDAIDQVTAARRQNASRLTAMLTDVDGVVTPTTTPKATHVHHQYAIRLELEKFTVSRDEFVQALEAEGVAAEVHYPRPVHRQPVFEMDRTVDTPTLPVSELLARQVICLPVHQHLTLQEVQWVGEAVAKVARAFRA